MNSDTLTPIEAAFVRAMVSAIVRELRTEGDGECRHRGDDDVDQGREVQPTTLEASPAAE